MARPLVVQLLSSKNMLLVVALMVLLLWLSLVVVLSLVLLLLLLLLLVVVVVDSCYRCVSTIAPRCLVGVSAVLTHRPGGLAAAAKKAAAGKDISYVFDNVILDTTKPGMMAAMAADMQVTPPNGHHHLTCGLAIPECQRRKSLPWTQLLPPLRSFARAGALPLEPGRCCGGGGAAAQQHPAEFGDRRRCTADPDCPYQPGPHQFILGQNS